MTPVLVFIAVLAVLYVGCWALGTAIGNEISKRR